MNEPEYQRATRAAYDTVAVDYAELLRTELARKPLDRAVLAAFAELVPANDSGLVADVGCGPGRVTIHLAELGLHVLGIDLSPQMIAAARAAHPTLQFTVGSMTALDLADGALAGAVAWYSIIHLPPDVLPAAFAELNRVLEPGGELLLAFQVGDERVHIERGYGHAVSLDAYRLSPDRIDDLLRDAGFAPHARLVREPDANEKTPQAYVMARKRSTT